MYVSMSRDHSDDGFFYCYNWNIITNQTESFKIRFFVSDFAIFIRGERERERECEWGGREPLAEAGCGEAEPDNSFTCS